MTPARTAAPSTHSRPGRHPGEPSAASADRAWEFRGYHSWNAYCGQAAVHGQVGVPPIVAPTRTSTAQPADTPAPHGRRPPAPPANLTAYQRELHRVHRLAAHLDRLRLDGAVHAQRHELPPELAYELADAIEILTDIRDSLTTARPHPTS